MIAAIDKDRRYSDTGRRQDAARTAIEAIAEHGKSPALTQAQKSVAEQMARWESKITSVLTEPEPGDAATALLYREIRDKFSSLGDDSLKRLQFIERFGASHLGVGRCASRIDWSQRRGAARVAPTP